MSEEMPNYGGKKKNLIDCDSFQLSTAAHSFNVSVAILFKCSDTATIINDMIHWSTVNKANEKSIHEGRVWFYMSIKAWNEKYLYMTPNKIRGILDRLEDEDFILSNNFNEKKYDRTKWYSLSDKAIELFNLPFVKITNAFSKSTNAFSKSTNAIVKSTVLNCDYNGPIPNTYTIIKTISNSSPTVEQPFESIETEKKETKKEKGDSLKTKLTKSHFQETDEVFKSFTDPKKVYETWLMFLDYKKAELRKTFKTSITESLAIKNLFELSDGNSQKAIECIEYSMANGYQGIFAKKEQKTFQGNSQSWQAAPTPLKAEIPKVSDLSAESAKRNLPTPIEKKEYVWLSLQMKFEGLTREDAVQKFKTDRLFEAEAGVISDRYDFLYDRKMFYEINKIKSLQQ